MSDGHEPAGRPKPRRKWTSTDEGGPFNFGWVKDEHGDIIGFETPWPRGLVDCEGEP